MLVAGQVVGHSEVGLEQLVEPHWAVEHQQQAVTEELAVAQERMFVVYLVEAGEFGRHLGSRVC